MAKNICIVHFNTPALTACLIRSINKYTPGTTIYVFDNSDKYPFRNEFENVVVFDNTKGQIINFTEWLNKYPTRLKSRGKVNNYGSAKHSISIEKCIELIGENFVLIDSDVLLKRDISGIWDGKYYWVGGVERWSQSLTRKRVCPFLLSLNVEKMKENNITFFDDKHMFGLNNGPKCEEYDTGCWLYEETLKKGRIIKYTDYIFHFRAGSWLNDAKTKHNYKQMPPKKWLTAHKKYWCGQNEVLPNDWFEKYEKPLKIESKNTDIKIKFNDIFDHIYCLHYLPDTERLEKMKDELKFIGVDENAKYFSWVFDYPSPLLDMVYNDSRVNMNTALKATNRSYIKRVSKKHYEIIKEAHELGYKRILVLENDIRFYKDKVYIDKLLSNMPDSDIIMFDKMVCSAPSDNLKYKKYIKTLPEDALYGDMNESGVFFIFCSCYSLNRTAMEHIIQAHEKQLLPPDTPLNDKTLTGSFAIMNMAIQDPNLKTRKTETYDKIGLDTGLYMNVADNKVLNQAEIKPQQKPMLKQTKPKKEQQKIVFRVPTKPQMKKKIEPAPVKKTQTQSSQPKPPKPIVTRKTVILNKKRNIHSRIIPAKSSGFNRLYDV